MHIKRYVAPNLPEALRQVKQELGPDALVLSTRAVRGDGSVFGWFSRSQVEVMAAVDRDVLPRSGGSGRPVEPDPSWKGLSLTRSLLDPLESELRALRRAVDGLGAAPVQEGLRREFVRVRRSLGDVAATRRRPAGSADPLARWLHAGGLGERHARAIAREARRRGGPTAREALRDALARRLDEKLRPHRDDEERRVALVVGAPGVGKTTTLAKLAARAESDAPGVALITTDVHRLGGPEALRAFAGRRGMPFEAANSAAEAAERVDRLGARRVWIDTAGPGASDGAALADLARLRASLGGRARVHLVVSATTKEEDLRAEVERFAPLAPDSMVVAKVDETSGLANVGNLLLDGDAPPLAWVGCGRRVPEDLSVAEPLELAGSMLGMAG